MDADIRTGKYVQGVCGGGGGHPQPVDLTCNKRFAEKTRRIERNLDGIKCGLLRSFDISLIT